MWTIICILFIGGSVYLYSYAYDLIKQGIKESQSEVIAPDSVYFGKQMYKVLKHEDGVFQIKENVSISEKHINLKPKQND